jgi:hypothetical protein
MKHLISGLFVVGLLFSSTQLAHAAYVDNARVVKVGIDYSLCGSTSCPVFVYFDKAINLTCNGYSDRAVLFLRGSASPTASDRGLDKMFNSIMSAYLAKSTVYARTGGCDSYTSNYADIEYFEIK